MIRWFGNFSLEISPSSDDLTVTDHLHSHRDDKTYTVIGTIRIRVETTTVWWLTCSTLRTSLVSWNRSTIFGHGRVVFGNSKWSLDQDVYNLVCVKPNRRWCPSLTTPTTSLLHNDTTITVLFVRLSFLYQGRRKRSERKRDFTPRVVPWCLLGLHTKNLRVEVVVVIFCLVTLTVYYLSY